mgnify:CR=1 FL=1
MLCVKANNTGKIIVDSFQPADASQCQGHVLVTPSEYVALNDSVTIDPVSVGATWGLAFALITSFWAAGFKISIARKGINSVR